MTNAEKIRAMTDVELAVFLCSRQMCGDCIHLYDGTCEGDKNGNLEWLKQEIPAPPQKKPLCDDCKHAIDGVVDDFAAVFCAARHGYFGQVAECKDYAPKEVPDNG